MEEKKSRHSNTWSKGCTQFIEGTALVNVLGQWLLDVGQRCFQFVASHGQEGLHLRLGLTQYPRLHFGFLAGLAPSRYPPDYQADVHTYHQHQPYADRLFHTFDGPGELR